MADGVLLTVHVAPVLAGRIVAFVFGADGPQGRWLPWTPLPPGANPYEIAAAIVDEWCDGAVSDLRLADVISREGEEGWGLAIVFRAALTAPPRGERGEPRPCDPQDLANIQGFAAVDIERWRSMGPAVSPPAPAENAPRLVF